MICLPEIDFFPQTNFLSILAWKTPLPTDFKSFNAFPKRTGFTLFIKLFDSSAAY